jgi:hypothetical protein
MAPEIIRALEGIPVDPGNFFTGGNDDQDLNIHAALV